MLNKNGTRELAYVAEIKSIDPIEGSDNCESASIDGWHVMVRKGIHHVGDKCVYFEVDSKLDTTKECFAFLEKCHGKIKTQKYTFGGKGLFYSQGLIMTLQDCGLDEDKYNIGDFLTEILEVKYADEEDNKRKEVKEYNNTFKKIKKWKVIRWIMRYEWGRKLIFKLFGVKKKKVDYPWFVIKTDEERCLSSHIEVLTNKGKIHIGKIVNNKMDVKVLSVNENGELEYKKIIGYQKIPKKEAMREVRYKNYNDCTSREMGICCTDDHKFLTDRGYVECKNLSKDDWIYNKSVGSDLECISAMYGMLLGDGCYQFDKRTHNNSGRLTWTQGINHKDYADYVKKLFGDNLKEYMMTSKKSFSDKPVIRYFFNRNNTLNSYLLYDNAIKNQKKYITPAYCERISSLGLALWFMDDGTKKIYNNKTTCDRCAMEIATNAYSEEENKNLVDMLQNKFGIKCKYYLTNKGYYQIYIYDEGTRRLTEIIGKYVPQSMRYKLNPFVEQEYPFNENFESFTFDKDILLPTQITRNIKVNKIPKRYGCNAYLYDITVEDNHNFFANNILTHNCQNLPQRVWEDKESTYEISEKIDGSSTTVAIERQKKGYKLWICSRNVVIWDSDTKKVKQGGYYKDLPTNPFVHSADMYKICEFLEDYMNKHEDTKWAYLQGETYGEGIQKRTYNCKGTDFRAFILTDDAGRYSYSRMKEVLDVYGIPTVPILKTGYILTNCDDLIKLAGSEKSQIDGGMREGIVLRNEQDTAFSFKAVDPSFLVKYH